MAQDDVLRAAFNTAPNPSDFSRVEHRAKRAQRTRAAALSPWRISLKLLFLPMSFALITLSIYVETSPYERSDALRHLAAMAGCDIAMPLGLAPAFRGSIGYHSVNDPDDDGVACPLQIIDNGPSSTSPSQTTAPSAPPLQQTGAKFIRP